MRKNPGKCTLSEATDQDNPPVQVSDATERNLMFTKAISRWDNEGGSGDGGRVSPAPGALGEDSLPLSNAELVQLQIRVIALENLLAVLLVDASDRQVTLARETAECIAPRHGFTPHRLTIHAAARMNGLLERSGHLRALQPAAASVGERLINGSVLDTGSEK